MAKPMFSIYTYYRRLVPQQLQLALGGSRLIAPLRNSLLRPSEQMRLEEGEISWEDLDFTFRAPYRTFLTAQQRGIENLICRLARSTLGPGDTAIDVGTDYGFVTLVMAFSVAPGGSVYAFEIIPETAAVLATTVQMNNLTSIVQITAQGAGPETAGGLVTVDSIVQPSAASTVRLVKIDTDGADYGVLQGSTGLLKAQHPIVVIEMHRQPQAIYDLLRELGYTYFVDLYENPVIPGTWPENLIASVEPVTIPPKGIWRQSPGPPKT